MRLEIRFRSLDASEALRAHASHRVHLQLGRFGQEVRQVVVRIGDVNGPRGGVDKRCQVTVRGPRLGTTAIEELDVDAYAAVDVALARAARSVRRQLDRARLARGVRAARPSWIPI